MPRRQWLELVTRKRLLQERFQAVHAAYGSPVQLTPLDSILFAMITPDHGPTDNFIVFPSGLSMLDIVLLIACHHLPRRR